jgi:hypothetical protein
VRTRLARLLALLLAVLIAVGLGVAVLGRTTASVAVRYSGGLSGPEGRLALQPGTVVLTRFGVTTRRIRLRSGQRTTLRLRPGVYSLSLDLGDADCSRTVLLLPGRTRHLDLVCSIK